MNRRQFIQSMAMAPILAAFPFSSAFAAAATGHVVVIGGGFGGSTFAKYLKLWAPGVKVTLIDRSERFVSCPLSNLILNDLVGIDKLTIDRRVSYAKNNIGFIVGDVIDVDTTGQFVALQSGEKVHYDRLVVSPGISFMTDNLPGLDEAMAAGSALHAYRTEHKHALGSQAPDLRDRLKDMHKGGVAVISIPMAPYRCPPAPYERACQMASFMKKNNPSGKVILLDANSDILIEKPLFSGMYSGVYKDVLSYVPNAGVKEIGVDGKSVFYDGGVIKADVLNVIPSQKAGDIAAKMGLANLSGRWCGVNPLTFESTAIPGIHIIGDAVGGMPLPKSGHVANQAAKVCAAAVAALMAGQDYNHDPILTHTCFSFVDSRTAGHISAMFRYDPEKKNLVKSEGTGGAATTATEPLFAKGMGWGLNILNDTMGS